MSVRYSPLSVARNRLKRKMKPPVPAPRAHQYARRKFDMFMTMRVGAGSSPPKSENILANTGITNISMKMQAPPATVSTMVG